MRWYIVLSLATGCASYDTHCSGQNIEVWHADSDFGNRGEWQTIACPHACVVLDVVIHDVEQIHEAMGYCAASNMPDPACDSMTGRRCSDSGHAFTCIDGYRVEQSDTGSVYPDACPSDRPHCVEPEPGLAFCVANPTPSPRCDGIPPKEVNVCAELDEACFTRAIGQSCADPTVSVWCLDGIEIKTETCTAPAQCTDWNDLEGAACQ